MSFAGDCGIGVTGREVEGGERSVMVLTVEFRVFGLLRLGG